MRTTATRVLYVNHTGLLSGAELSLLAIAQRLPDGYESLIASPSGPFADRVRGLGIHHLPIPNISQGLGGGPGEVASFGLQAGAALRRLRSVIQVTKPDIVHANSVRAGLQVVAAVPTRPFALCVHVRDAVMPRHVGRPMAEMLLRRADQTIFVSKYVRERAAVPSSGNYVVIHNGVDPDDWKTQGRRGSSLESSGLGESDGPILLLPAQLAEWKGQADAVRALAIIRSTFSTARLVLAGETKDPTPAARAANAAFVLDLERLIAELGLSSCVHLLGHVEDMSELYDLADVVLVPSFQEPFGRTVIEGMAAGRVVIATDEGGPPEIIQNGRTGILLPPRRPSLWAEEIARILSDRPRREAIAAAAEVSVRKDFSIERCVRDCLSSYGTAIQIETRRRHRASSVRQREGYADES